MKVKHWCQWALMFIIHCLSPCSLSQLQSVVFTILAVLEITLDPLTRGALGYNIRNGKTEEKTSKTAEAQKNFSKTEHRIQNR